VDAMRCSEAEVGERPRPRARPLHSPHPRPRPSTRPGPLVSHQGQPGHRRRQDPKIRLLPGPVWPRAPVTSRPSRSKVLTLPPLDRFEHLCYTWPPSLGSVAQLEPNLPWRCRCPPALSAPTCRGTRTTIGRAPARMIGAQKKHQNKYRYRAVPWLSASPCLPPTSLPPILPLSTRCSPPATGNADPALVTQATFDLAEGRPAARPTPRERREALGVVK
jgi:hypothetical protein